MEKDVSPQTGIRKGRVVRMERRGCSLRAQEENEKNKQNPSKEAKS